jgi:hypothetical protein
VSVSAIAQSTEVPLLFEYQDPRPLCAHKVFFKAQSCVGGKLGNINFRCMRLMLDALVP